MQHAAIAAAKRRFICPPNELLNYAMIESSRMLLEWLGRNRGIAPAVEAARAMSLATTRALADPKSRTGDIRGTGDTASMTRAIIAAL